MAAAVSPETTADGTAWHAITVDEVLRRLATSAEHGLDAGEASARLQKYGPNRLPEGRKRGPFMRFSPSSTTSWSTCCSARASPR